MLGRLSGPIRIQPDFRIAGYTDKWWFAKKRARSMSDWPFIAK